MLGTPILYIHTQYVVSYTHDTAVCLYVRTVEYLPYRHIPITTNRPFQPSTRRRISPKMQIRPFSAAAAAANGVMALIALRRNIIPSPLGIFGPHTTIDEARKPRGQWPLHRASGLAPFLGRLVPVDFPKGFLQTPARGIRVRGVAHVRGPRPNLPSFMSLHISHPNSPSKPPQTGS